MDKTGNSTTPGQQQHTTPRKGGSNSRNTKSNHRHAAANHNSAHTSSRGGGGGTSSSRDISRGGANTTDNSSTPQQQQHTNYNNNNNNNNNNLMGVRRATCDLPPVAATYREQLRYFIEGYTGGSGPYHHQQQYAHTRHLDDNDDDEGDAADVAPPLLPTIIAAAVLGLMEPSSIEAAQQLSETAPSCRMQPSRNQQQPHPPQAQQVASINNKGNTISTSTVTSDDPPSLDDVLKTFYNTAISTTLPPSCPPSPHLPPSPSTTATTTRRTAPAVIATPTPNYNAHQRKQAIKASNNSQQHPSRAAHHHCHQSTSSSSVVIGLASEVFALSNESMTAPLGQGNTSSTTTTTTPVPTGLRAPTTQITIEPRRHNKHKKKGSTKPPAVDTSSSATTTMMKSSRSHKLIGDAIVTYLFQQQQQQTSTTTLDGDAQQQVCRPSDSSQQQCSDDDGEFLCCDPLPSELLCEVSTTIQLALGQITHSVQPDVASPIVVLGALRLLAVARALNVGAIGPENWFRLFFGSLLVATKMHLDIPRSRPGRGPNSAFAAVLSLTGAKEMTFLEVELLYLVDFNLRFTSETEFDDFAAWILNIASTLDRCPPAGHPLPPSENSYECTVLHWLTLVYEADSHSQPITNNSTAMEGPQHQQQVSSYPSVAASGGRGRGGASTSKHQRRTTTKGTHNNNSTSSIPDVRSRRPKRKIILETDNWVVFAQPTTTTTPTQPLEDASRSSTDLVVLSQNSGNRQSSGMGGGMMPTSTPPRTPIKGGATWASSSGTDHPLHTTTTSSGGGNSNTISRGCGGGGPLMGTPASHPLMLRRPLTSPHHPQLYTSNQASPSTSPAHKPANAGSRRRSANNMTPHQLPSSADVGGGSGGGDLTRTVSPLPPLAPSILALTPGAQQQHQPPHSLFGAPPSSWPRSETQQYTTATSMVVGSSVSSSKDVGDASTPQPATTTAGQPPLHQRRRPSSTTPATASSSHNASPVHSPCSNLTAGQPLFPSDNNSFGSASASASAPQHNQLLSQTAQPLAAPTPQRGWNAPTEAIENHLEMFSTDTPRIFSKRRRPHGHRNNNNHTTNTNTTTTDKSSPLDGTTQSSGGGLGGVGGALGGGGDTTTTGNSSPVGQTQHNLLSSINTVGSAVASPNSNSNLGVVTSSSTTNIITTATSTTTMRQYPHQHQQQLPPNSNTITTTTTSILPPSFTPITTPVQPFSSGSFVVGQSPFLNPAAVAKVLKTHSSTTGSDNGGGGGGGNTPLPHDTPLKNSSTIGGTSTSTTNNSNTFTPKGTPVSSGTPQFGGTFPPRILSSAAPSMTCSPAIQMTPMHPGYTSHLAPLDTTTPTTTTRVPTTTTTTVDEPVLNDPTAMMQCTELHLCTPQQQQHQHLPTTQQLSRATTPVTNNTNNINHHHHALHYEPLHPLEVAVPLEALSAGRLTPTSNSVNAFPHYENNNSLVALLYASDALNLSSGSESESSYDSWLSGDDLNGVPFILERNDTCSPPPLDALDNSTYTQRSTGTSMVLSDPLLASAAPQPSPHQAMKRMPSTPDQSQNYPSMSSRWALRQQSLSIAPTALSSTLPMPPTPIVHAPLQRRLPPHHQLQPRGDGVTPTQPPHQQQQQLPSSCTPPLGPTAPPSTTPTSTVNTDGGGSVEELEEALRGLDPSSREARLLRLQLVRAKKAKPSSSSPNVSPALKAAVPTPSTTVAPSLTLSETGTSATIPTTTNVSSSTTNNQVVLSATTNTTLSGSGGDMGLSLNTFVDPTNNNILPPVAAIRTTINSPTFVGDPDNTVVTPLSSSTPHHQTGSPLVMGTFTGLAAFGEASSSSAAASGGGAQMQLPTVNVYVPNSASPTRLGISGVTKVTSWSTDDFPSGVGEDGRTQPASPCGPNSSILLSTTSGPHWKHRVVPPVFLTPLQAPTGSRPFDSTDEENDDEEEDTTTTTITRRTSTKTDRLTTIDDEEDEGNNVEEPLPQQVVGINQLEIPAFPEALESLESGFCGVDDDDEELVPPEAPQLAATFTSSKESGGVNSTPLQSGMAFESTPHILVASAVTSPVQQFQRQRYLSGTLCHQDINNNEHHHHHNTRTTNNNNSNSLYHHNNNQSGDVAGGEEDCGTAGGGDSALQCQLQSSPSVTSLFGGLVGGGTQHSTGGGDDNDTTPTTTTTTTSASGVAFSSPPPTSQQVPPSPLKPTFYSLQDGDGDAAAAGATTSSGGGNRIGGTTPIAWGRTNTNNSAHRGLHVPSPFGSGNNLRRQRRSADGGLAPSFDGVPPPPLPPSLQHQSSSATTFTDEPLNARQVESRRQSTYGDFPSVDAALLHVHRRMSTPSGPSSSPHTVALALKAVLHSLQPLPNVDVSGRRCTSSEYPCVGGPPVVVDGGFSIVGKCPSPALHSPTTPTPSSDPHSSSTGSRYSVCSAGILFFSAHQVGAAFLNSMDPHYTIHHQQQHANIGTHDVTTTTITHATTASTTPSIKGASSTTGVVAPFGYPSDNTCTPPNLNLSSRNTPQGSNYFPPSSLDAVVQQQPPVAVVEVPQQTAFSLMAIYLLPQLIPLRFGVVSSPNSALVPNR